MRTSDGDLYRNDFWPEELPQLLHSSVEVSILPIHLVDKNHAGKLSIVSVLPSFLCANLDTRRSTHNNQGRISDAPCCNHVAHEIEIAWRVQDIDLMVIPLHRSESSVDGYLTAYLLRITVQNRSPVIHLPQTGSSFGGK